jgi:hypothetical protein
MFGYEIVRLATGRFVLSHGTKTPGFNNHVPVKSLEDAWRIAEDWHYAGIPKPYPPANRRDVTNSYSVMGA